MGIELEEVHLAIFLVTVVAILYADHLGFDYMRGKRTLLPPRLVSRLHYGVFTGLALMIATGSFLFMRTSGYYLNEPLFFVKVGFVLPLILNGWFIAKMSRIASERPFTLLSREERSLLFLSGALSAIGWIGSATIGYFFL